VYESRSGGRDSFNHWAVRRFRIEDDNGGRLTRPKYDSITTVAVGERGAEKSQNRCDNQEKRDHQSLLLREF
jgi:hypothetical protein